jgi:N6-L-threonylcarbamoyladenine synthase
LLVLGIETSCDETAAALVQDGRVILSNVVASQGEAHSTYGGVVPELASRMHLENIVPIVKTAFREAGIEPAAIHGVGVTNGPGLVGSLLVGINFAKAFAFALGKPLVGVNHVEGHLGACFLAAETPRFPFLALVVSGGHTGTYLVREKMTVYAIGQTRDDAAGEAFDKGAKLLGIGYPGGMIIDRLAGLGNPEAIKFPRPLAGELDFSFSGLKTALLNHVHKNGLPATEENLADLAASYQEAIVEVLVTKTIQAARLAGVTELALCGGVAANSRLRSKLAAAAREKGYRLIIPPAFLCTDNAAMVAAIAELLLAQGNINDGRLDAYSYWRAPRLSLS